MFKGARTSRSFRLLIAVMVWLGSMVLLYSPAAQWVEQRAQSRANEALAGTVQQIGPEGRSRMLDEAREYNRTLASGLPVDDFDYGSLMNPGGSGILARLRIPSIDLDQPVRHTLDEDVLARALGHAEGSSLPVGGESTNALIGGHRGLATAVGFTRLNEVEVGDEFFIEVGGEVLTYRIRSYEVLPPGEAEVQPIVPGEDLVTLITCTPLGLNTDRIVAVGERVQTPEAEVAGVAPQIPRFPWWLVAAGGVTTAAIALVAWPTRTRQHDPQPQEPSPAQAVSA